MNQEMISTRRDAPALPSFWETWGLIKQELIFLCWSLMEVAIIAPLALIVMNWARYWSVGALTLWLLLLILLPFNLIRLLSALGIPRERQWRILLAALLLTLFISWRGLLYAPRPLLDWAWLGEFVGHLGNLGNPFWGRDLVIFIFTLLAWWRGMRLAQMAPDIYRIGFRLRAGVLLLAPLALVLYASGNFWGATPFVLLYFLAGLTALSLIRAEQIERERSGFAASLTPQWVAIVFITSLLVVMTGGLAGALMSGEVMTVLSGRLAPLWSAMLATLAVSLATLLYLLSPVLFIFSFLVTQLTNLFSRIFAAGFDIAPLEANSQESLDMLSEAIQETNRSGLIIPSAVSQILAALIMLGAAALVTYSLVRRFRQPPIAAPSGVAYAPSHGDRRQSDSFADRLLGRLGFARRWRTSASIRRIYSEMCATAAAAGHPRGTAQTPYEYLAALQSAWPDNHADSLLITEAYVRVRYGEVPETEQELQAIRSAWAELSMIRPSEGATSNL